MVQPPSNSSEHVVDDALRKTERSTAMRGSLVPDVSRKSAGYGIKEWKHRGAPCLRPADANRTRTPIQILEHQPGHLGGAHPVGGHHEDDREIAPPRGTRHIDPV